MPSPQLSRRLLFILCGLAAIRQRDDSLIVFIPLRFIIISNTSSLQTQPLRSPCVRLDGTTQCFPLWPGHIRSEKAGVDAFVCLGTCDVGYRGADGRRLINKVATVLLSKSFGSLSDRPRGKVAFHFQPRSATHKSTLAP